jgi:hypothetical protein
VTDTSERLTAGRATGLLWLVGGISGALWYLVPGADTEHWQLADRRLRRAKDAGKDRWITRSEADLHVHAT